MSVPQMSLDDAGRARWLKIAAGVWLVLVSGIAIVDSVSLSRLIEQSRSSAQDAKCRRSPPVSAISNIRPKPRSASPSLSSKATSTLPARRWNISPERCWLLPLPVLA